MRLQRKDGRCRALCLALFAAAVFAASAQPESGASGGVNLRFGIKIPMRDGTRLNANLYLPPDPLGPQPVVFVLTPYTTDRYYVDDCLYYARNGYACAIVDVRGRGGSEGRYEPFEKDAFDGYDAVEWFARQSWSNGKVAMFGLSYSGYAQWTVLKEFPPHLSTVVPTAAVYVGYDFPIGDGNIMSDWMIAWLTGTGGVVANPNLAINQDFWDGRAQALYLGQHAFADYDQVAGNPTEMFHRWLAHPTPDAYWNAMTPTAADYRKIHIPILTITGSYDDDQPGALHYYRQHMSLGAAADTDRHYLMIGPWNHLGTHKPEAAFDGLKFGPAGQIDMLSLHRQWFDWTMKGGGKPDFLKQRVAYYVAGPEQWKYADRLEDIGAGSRKFYLASEGRADDVFHSGTLSEQDSSPAAADAYTYDPVDFHPYAPKQGRTYAFDCASEADVSANACDAMGIQGNGLVYHSAPLGEDVEFSGSIKLSVWLEMDVPDTDILANVDEVRIDGSIVHLSVAGMRARYRLSRTEARPVEMGKPLRYDFSTFPFNARRLAKGSRLRLTLAPPSPAFERNYNSGKAVEYETEKDAKVAHIRLLHDAQHRSVLELPVAAVVGSD